METSYQTYYNEQLEKGLQFQDFVIDMLYEIGLPISNYTSKQYQQEFGENRNGIEIKFNPSMRKYDSLWIELKEKANPANLNYVDSGIYRNDNAWLYAIGDREEFFIFGKKQLIKMHKCGKFGERTSLTSVGMIVTLDYAREYGLKVFRQKEAANK